jgi:hypothetical protein
MRDKKVRMVVSKHDRNAKKKCYAPMQRELQGHRAMVMDLQYFHMRNQETPKAKRHF